jgi:hypothetical protein
LPTRCQHVDLHFEQVDWARAETKISGVCVVPLSVEQALDDAFMPG